MKKTKEECNELILKQIKEILDNRSEDKLYTITIDIFGDIGALITVEMDSMYEEPDCCAKCFECGTQELKDILSLLKEVGIEARFRNN